LVTGDDKLAREVGEALPTGVRRVVTKYGSTYNAARMRPVPVVHDEIRREAAVALRSAGSIAPLKVSAPVRVQVRFRGWQMLHLLEAVPGVRRLDAHTFTWEASDMTEAQQYFMTLHRLARS
jgi:D-aminopeptidase